MSKLALFIKVTCKPGKRDEVYALWEEHLKPRLNASELHEAYYLCYDTENENVLYGYEVLSEASQRGQFAETDWFKEYMEKVFPLFDGEIEFNAMTPIWMKGAETD